MSSGNSATSVRGPAGAKKGGKEGLASLCRALLGPGNNGGAGRGGGDSERDGRGRGPKTERGDRVRPRGGRNCLSLCFPLAPKQSASPRGRKRGRNEQPKREKTAERESREREGNRVRRKGSKQAARRKGTEGAEGQRTGEPGRTLPESRQNPPAQRGSGVSPSVPAASEARWAGLRCVGTGRQLEGNVRGSEAAAGNRTYVPSACWRRRCAELACRGTLGPSGASHRAG